jgi:hypothetical protein
MAFQDSWARPLADELVSLFRVDSISYVRRGVPVYDPASGQTNHAEQIFTKAGALTKYYKLEVWLYAGDIEDEWPTTRDYFIYNEEEWKVIDISPIFSGDTKYACKCIARAQ